jgi:hypothetical protein
MSYTTKTEQIYANRLLLTSKTGNDVDIVCSTGNVKINGLLPTGGSGTSLPIDGVGDITITGNLDVNGDGVATGLIEGENVHCKGPMRVDGKLSVPTNDIEVTTGKITLSAGNLEQGGSGKITSGSGGVESYGDITTVGAHDLIIGRDIYFDGNDIYKRENNPPQDISYKTFKGLIGKADNNIFTGTNDFADKVRLGTESGGVFTESGLTLNTNGDLQSVNINNTTLLQCGNINCGNGGTNEIRCKKIITRTTEDDVNNPDGWIITQEAPSNPAQTKDRILDIQSQEANAFIAIRSNEQTQIYPNLVLNPRTNALGGEMVAAVFSVGKGSLTDFKIEQPRTGTDVDNMLVTMGGGTNAKIKFKNETGADLMFIEEATAGQADGRIYISDGIYFGVTGIHNHITESGNNLLIDQNDATSETQIRDNTSNPIISVKKTEVVLSNPLPLKFGLYSFRPIQYKLTRTLTIAASPDTTNFTNMAFNCQSDTWTLVNDNSSVSMYNAALEGYYKCTISQTGASSAGNFDFCDIIFDYVLRLSIQTSPDIDITEPSFNYRKKPTNQARPTIEIDHLNTPVQSQPVFVLYPNQSVGETMPIEVRLTKLDF